MNERLDHLVEKLASLPTDHPLDDLEPQVSRGVAARREQVRTIRALAPVRVASIGLALAVGVTAGGLTAAASVAVPATPSPTALAPSTLLEDAR